MHPKGTEKDKKRKLEEDKKVVGWKRRRLPKPKNKTVRKKNRSKPTKQTLSLPLSPTPSKIPCPKRRSSLQSRENETRKRQPKKIEDQKKKRSKRTMKEKKNNPQRPKVWR